MTTCLSAAEPVRLTDDGRLKMDPVFTAGGARVVFTVLESPLQLALARLEMANLAVERVHPEAKDSEFGPCVSPDERYLVFQRNDGNLHMKLVIKDLQADAETTFNPGGGFAGLGSISVAPDGGRVLFCFPDGAGQQIWTVDIEGNDKQALTNSGALDDWARYSPDGSRIVFGSSRDGDFEIYTMNPDGGDVRRLTHSAGRDVRPRWSPDGGRIAFTSARDGDQEIYVMNADGSNVRRVTEHPERDDYAAWHPDGQKLVVVSERQGAFDLYLVDAPR